MDLDKAQTTIYEQFRKAQQKFLPVIKDKAGNKMQGTFSYYATLDQCMNAVLEPLHKEGLSLTQKVEPTEQGVTVETVITNDKGDSISSGKLFIGISGLMQKGAQAYGSALTYARRYCLMTFLGLCPEDDDGRGASGEEHGRPGRSSYKVYQITQDSKEDLFERARKAASLGYAGLCDFMSQQPEDQRKVLRPIEVWGELSKYARERDKELGENKND